MLQSLQLAWGALTIVCRLIMLIVATQSKLNFMIDTPPYGLFADELITSNRDAIGASSSGFTIPGSLTVDDEMLRALIRLKSESVIHEIPPCLTALAKQHATSRGLDQHANAFVSKIFSQEKRAHQDALHMGFTMLQPQEGAPKILADSLHSTVPNKEANILHGEQSFDLSEDRSVFTTNSHGGRVLFRTMGESRDFVTQIDQHVALQSQREAQLSNILNDQQLAEKVLAELNNIDLLFTQAAGCSNQIENIEAQIALIEHKPSLPSVLQHYVTHARSALINVLVDKKGKFRGIRNSKDLQKAQNAIKNFKQMSTTLQDAFSKKTDATAFGTNSIFSIDPNPHSMWEDFKQCIGGLCGFNATAQQKQAKFLKHQANEYCSKTIMFIKQGDFFDAKDYLKLLEQEAAKNTIRPGIHNVIQAYYRKEYDKQYDSYGIKKTFASDPLHTQFAHFIENASKPYEKEKLQQLAEFQLTVRELYYREIVNRLQIPGEIPPPVQYHAYKLIPLFDKPYEARKYLSDLSIDHLDDLKREAYPYFFDEHGMLKLYAYDRNNLLDIQLPESIHKDANSDIRLLRNEFTTIRQVNETAREQVRRGLLDLKAALHHESLSKELTYLAQKRYNAIADPKADKAILELGSFDSFDDDAHQRINDELIISASNALKKLESACEKNTQQLLPLKNTLLDIELTRTALHSGNLPTAEKYIQKSNTPILETGITQSTDTISSNLLNNARYVAATGTTCGIAKGLHGYSASNSFHGHGMPSSQHIEQDDDLSIDMSSLFGIQKEEFLALIQKNETAASFLPNGIASDFADNSRATSLVLPPVILSEEYTNIRNLLNYLVYLEQQCSDANIAQNLHTAIEALCSIAQKQDPEQIAVLRRMAHLYQNILTDEQRYAHSIAQDLILLKNADAETLRELADLFNPNPKYPCFYFDQEKSGNNPDDPNKGPDRDPKGPGPQKNNDNKNKEKPPRSFTEKVAAMRDKEKIASTIILMEQYCDELKIYFDHMLQKYPEIVEEVFQKTGIRISSMNFRHLFEATINGRQRVAGFHSPMFFSEYIYKITEKSEHMFKAIVRMINKKGNPIEEVKTFFPEHMNGYTIIEKFFESCRNINPQEILKTNGGSCWIESIEIKGQIYRWFI